MKETRSWFCLFVCIENVNKIDKPPIRLSRRRKIQNTNIRNDRGDITTDSTNVKRTIRDNCEKLYDNKVNNLDERDKFFDTKYQNSLKMQQVT